MRKLIICTICLLPFAAAAQSPFETRAVTKKKIVKSNASNNPRDNGQGTINGGSATNAVIADEKETATFFSSQSATLVFDDQSSSMFPALNSSIINYRLGIHSRQTKKKGSQDDSVMKRTYIPFSLLSNVTTNFGKTASAVANEATTFFGSLLTFRITPHAVVKVGAENQLVFGLIQDLRLYSIGDTVTNKLTAAFGYYGAAGLTFFGPGTVDDESGKEYSGRWAFSSLFYWFKSGGKFDELVFKNQPAKWLSGVEFLLKFKTSAAEASKFNFLVGAKYGLAKGTPSADSWNFRIGVGN